MRIGIIGTGTTAGDDDEAKETVSTLSRDMGFHPVDVGPLEATRALERLHALQGQFGFWPNTAIRILRP